MPVFFAPARPPASTPDAFAGAGAGNLLLILAVAVGGALDRSEAALPRGLPEEAMAACAGGRLAHECGED